ncbi:MAG: HD domain-containing protein [Clostridia bacterium]|nr:HD domain-containing protein [Clostridia bacterium]
MLNRRKILTIARYYVIPLVFVPLMIMGFYMMRLKISDYQQDLDIKAQLTLDGISAVFQGVDDAIEEDLQTYAAVDVFQKLDLNEEDRQLIRELLYNRSKNSALQDIAFGSAKGEVFSLHKDDLPMDYDPRYRPWYLDGAKAEDEVIISLPYQDARNDSNWTLTYALRVKNSAGKITGVLGSDMKVEGLESYLNEFFKSFEGRILILDSNSRVVIEKDDTSFRLSDKSGIAFDLIAKDGLDIHVEYEGVEYRMDKITIKGMDWSVVLLTPTDLVMQQLFRILMPLMVSFLFILIVMHLFTSAIKRVLILPLERVSKQIDEVSIKEYSESLNFNIPIPKEVSIIVDAINRMLSRIYDQTVALQKQKEEINGQYEEINSLYEETTAMNDALNDLLDEVQGSYRNTIYALSSAIEANDAYTKGHCDRVKDYALKLGEKCGLCSSELQTLEYAAILHDVGKVGIPSDVLNKASRLTEEEWEIVKQHPLVGAQILKDIPYLEAVCTIIEQHHERIDGQGYPYGLKEHEINKFAQILCIADAYDAMTSKRPYKDCPMTIEEAIAELRASAGKQFSQAKVEFFIEILQNEL